MFLRIKLKLEFKTYKTMNLWYGSDTMTIFFYIWTHGKEKLLFACESSKKSITFLNLDAVLCNGRLEITAHVKCTN